MRLVVLVLVLLSACRGDPADEASAPKASTGTTATTETATTAEAPVSRDCPYVTEEVLTTALETTAETISGSAASCSFWTGDDLRIQVTRVAVEGDAVAALDQARSHCVTDTVVDVETGEGAFACIAVGVIATVAADGQLITLGATGTPDDPTVRDAFAQVLPQLTP